MLGLGALTLTSDRASAVDATLSETSTIEIETRDGNLATLTVAPEGRVEWDGLERPASSAELGYEARVETEEDGDGEQSEFASAGETLDLDIDGLVGSRSFAFDETDLLVDVLDAEWFRPADGRTRERTVTLRLSVTVFDVDDDVLATGETGLPIQVRVENVESSGTTADAESNADATAENTPTETPTETETTETSTSTETPTDDGSSE